VIEDFGRSAATVSARTTPLVPASGIVVAGATFLAKDGDVDSAIVAGLAIGLALVGLGFLAMSVFTHAGRPRVGLPPTRGDIAFVHARLTKKESSAPAGSFWSLVGFVVLLLAIL
jgi:dipeptide/tripeptide permease